MAFGVYVIGEIKMKLEYLAFVGNKPAHLKMF